MKKGRVYIGNANVELELIGQATTDKSQTYFTQCCRSTFDSNI